MKQEQINFRFLNNMAIDTGRILGKGFPTRVSNPVIKCSVEGCYKPEYKLGLCEFHYGILAGK